jgi:signal transduction histidine kinase
MSAAIAAFAFNQGHTMNEPFSPTPPEAAARSMPRLPAAGTRDDQLLWWIVDATSGYTGDDFFNSLVSHLAMALKLKYVFITECLDYPVTKVRTLARWAGTGLTPNVTFNLDGTACKDTIIEKRVCFVPDKVGDLFYQERAFDRASYYGIPIFDTARENVIGHLAFYDNKRIESEIFSNPVFHIFASRAEAEMQRRRAEEESRAHLQQLAHVSRVGSMGELASAIAHEVNQPLAAITSYARACEALMGGSQELPADMREAVNGIIAQAERAAAITQRLRGFLRDGEMATQAISPNRVALDAAELARAEARKHRILLETQFDLNIADALGDPVQIQQVLFNLVRNAIDALADQPELTKWVIVSTRATAGGKVEIAVTDNGPGVPGEARDKVFDPFFTTKPDGMGIGLSLARTIAQNAGGSLELDATHEGGARFVLTLSPAPAAHPRN